MKALAKTSVVREKRSGRQVMSDVAMTADNESSNTDTVTVVWSDPQRRVWTLQLSPQNVALCSGDDRIDVPRQDWVTDIYVSPHGSDYIIRFSTADREIGFIVTSDQAAPLLSHIELVPQEPSQLDVIIQDEPGQSPLLWPKVSPLAVWAVICSSLVFIPIAGIVPAVMTIVLLFKHKQKVRSSRSFNHSRTLCRVAAAFLIAGAAAHVLALDGISRNSTRANVSYDELSISAPPQDARPAEASQSLRSPPPLLGVQPFWERDSKYWGMIVAGMIVVISSLSFHEAAHAVTAWWLGDDFARRDGRVTLSPIAHIDPLGTILLPLILFMAGRGVFGWAKPVPVRLDHVKRPRRAHILISIAGPGVNLLLASASLTLLLLLGCTVGMVFPEAEVINFSGRAFLGGVTASGFPLASVFGAVCTVLQLSFLINVFLACFNLIPIPPLDGSWVLEKMFPRTLGPIYDRIRPFGFIMFLILIYSDLLEYLLLPVMLFVVPGVFLLSRATPF